MIFIVVSKVPFKSNHVMGGEIIKNNPAVNNLTAVEFTNMCQKYAVANKYVVCFQERMNYSVNETTGQLEGSKALVAVFRRQTTKGKRS